jgi:hypothetical protein
MPIPTPNPDEEKTAFLTRCIDALKNEYNLDQRVAVCYREWENKKTN